MMKKHAPFFSALIMFYVIICLAVDHLKVDVRWINLAALLAAMTYLGHHLLIKRLKRWIRARIAAEGSEWDV